MTAPVLEVRDLAVEVATDRGWLTVVDGVDFEVAAGETLGIVGESGSGKTVTGLAVTGLLERSARIRRGSVRLGGEELVGRPERALEDIRGNRISMIFQEPMTSLNPAYPVGEQIAEGVRRHRGLGRRAAYGAAVAALERVGIARAADRARSYPHEFSGGMRQRVMIAMAIVCEPQVLIADEPTTALDVTIQAQILDLLRQMRDDLGLALVLVTHNMGVVADLCDRVAVMYAGQLVEVSPVEELFESPRHPYTEGLLRAVPRLEEIDGRLSFIPGGPPEPHRIPVGCRFHPRCAYRHDRCCEAPVPLVAAGARAVRCVRAAELDLTGVRP
ncbi:ABC transporter ATP-binding protein [Solwaraspora sp. WMMD1047]|uniref:ABC transporter ATP-binding protein n=1 Tax=Solwaraspora sp. WMMD1047 TaxID=3016102 RepID=UPI002415E686|nr:ABC transporter ATP-binding protein [Solwaraspora sp. WMMD1047]MDG4834295.1 ABC transporter ATP-binding protein [Solwaraspora sp. WMMD1047]